MEDRLWDYIDGLSSPTERSAIEILIASNREWQQKHAELLHTTSFSTARNWKPPLCVLQKNVMEEISRYHVAPATKSYIIKISFAASVHSF